MTAHTTTRPQGTSALIARIALVAVCTAWVVVALSHPTSLANEDVPTWMTVHIAQLVFAPIVALGILALLKGIEAPAATLSRGAVLLWAAWFSAYDAVAGIATGLLNGGDAEAAGESLFEHGLVTGLGWVAPGMWLLGVISAGLALRASRAPTVTYVALFGSALVFTHAGPPAAIGFAALAVALWTGLMMDNYAERWRSR
jgi:hypothetical protein